MGSIVLDCGVKLRRVEQVASSRSRAYSTFRLVEDAQGMDYLRGVFDHGRCNEYNLVLFGTSGIHGSYWSLDDCEEWLTAHPDARHDTWAGEEDDESWPPTVTFVVLQPRTVTATYGNVLVRDLSEAAWLRRLAGTVVPAVQTVLAGSLPVRGGLRADHLTGWTQGDVLAWASGVGETDVRRGEEPTAAKVALALSVLDVVQGGAEGGEEFYAQGCEGILLTARQLLDTWEAAAQGKEGAG